MGWVFVVRFLWGFSRVILYRRPPVSFVRDCVG